MHHRGRKSSSLALVFMMMLMQSSIKVSLQHQQLGLVMGVNAYTSFVLNKNQHFISSSVTSSHRLAVTSTSSLKSRVFKSTLYMWGEQPSSKNEGIPPRRIPQQQVQQTVEYSSSSSRPIRPPRRGGGSASINNDDSGVVQRK
jgi:hypothetical protein